VTKTTESVLSLSKVRNLVQRLGGQTIGNTDFKVTIVYTTESLQSNGTEQNFQPDLKLKDL